ncbi:MAG: homoserine kinase [Patescibacteria group bacterium]|jgi:homoserine kinase type II
MIKRSIPKTKLSKGDFIKILSCYNLGEFKSAKYFTHGWVNTTVLLETTKGKFVLRYYENRSARHVLYEVNILNYLKKKNFPVAVPLQNSAGKFIGQYKSKPYIIIEYIDAKSIKNPNNISSREELSEVIKVVAKLHNITKKYKPNYASYHQKQDIKHCLEEYKKHPRKLQKKVREGWFKNELAKLELPAALPKGVCHADLNNTNFLFKNRQVVVLLDFDVSFYTYLIFDVANLIYWWAWSPKKGFDMDLVNYIVKQYSKHRKLNNLEQNHIYDALKLIILLGISWSEDGDFEPEKKKIEQLNSLGREVFSKI